jgi:hypothetical protein
VSGVPPLLALRQVAPPHTDVSATLRKVGTVHDQNEAFDQVRVVEGDVLGDQTAGRQAHEANLSEVLTQHLGVVRSQLFVSGGADGPRRRWTMYSVYSSASRRTP